MTSDDWKMLAGALAALAASVGGIAAAIRAAATKVARAIANHAETSGKAIVETGRSQQQAMQAAGEPALVSQRLDQVVALLSEMRAEFHAIRLEQVELKTAVAVLEAQQRDK